MEKPDGLLLVEAVDIVTVGEVGKLVTASARPVPNRLSDEPGVEECYPCLQVNRGY